MDTPKASKMKLKQDFPLPARPPVLCPGCAHRGVFYTLKQFNPVIIGDIGCYSLGGLAPLDSMDAIICMGAGVSTAMGVAKSGLDRPVVGIVGDSTFFHSGITGLLDIGYNNGNLTIIVLDNRVTAMTGHQQNPGTGITLSGERGFQARIEKFAEASGISRIRVFDPYDLAQTAEVMKEELHCGQASILISRRPCVLIQKNEEFTLYSVDAEICRACGKCLKLGCPAIEKKNNVEGKWVAFINQTLCTGCSVCAQVCPFDAIGESK
jgi:indolepyruvate ferredoxin oxidoreductase alpha subunit